LKLSEETLKTMYGDCYSIAICGDTKCDKCYDNGELPFAFHTCVIKMPGLGFLIIRSKVKKVTFSGDFLL